MRSAFLSTFRDQLRHRIALWREAPSGAQQPPRQLAPVGDDPDEDLVFAFHRLPVQTISRLDPEMISLPGARHFEPRLVGEKSLRRQLP